MKQSKRSLTQKSFRQCREHLFYGCLLLLLSCTVEEDGGDRTGAGGETFLQPSFFAGTTVTRADDGHGIVSGTNGTGTNGNIKAVTLYVGKEDLSAAYPGITNHANGDGFSTFTPDGDSWKGTPVVKLHNETARILAFTPAGAGITNGSSGSSLSIDIELDKDMTFDGSSTWDCSAVDYLYGSNTNVVDPATTEAINAARITANNKSNYSPSIYLHHALAQIEFRMKKKDGLANEYDFVKKITVTAGTGQPFRTGSGSMVLTDGTIAGGSMGNSLSFAPTTNAVQCGSTQSVKVAFGLVAPLASQPGDDLSMTIVFGKADLNDSSADRELTVKSSQFNKQWKKGRKFVYNLVLTDHAIEVGTTEIESWTPEKNDSAGDAYPDGFKSIN